MSKMSLIMEIIGICLNCTGLSLHRSTDLAYDLLDYFASLEVEQPIPHDIIEMFFCDTKRIRCLIVSKMRMEQMQSQKDCVFHSQYDREEEKFRTETQVS
ncbi:MAG: hypothetical protein ACE5OZ_24920 [Candidatus Heimdallarchaeota archaeon]